jgi:hypothetical protein
LGTTRQLQHFSSGACAAAPLGASSQSGKKRAAKLTNRATNKQPAIMTDIGTPILPAGDDILDFCAVGALVHRLDSGIMPMRKASELKVRATRGTELRASSRRVLPLPRRCIVRARQGLKRRS